jgi:hypothetical protein
LQAGKLNGHVEGFGGPLRSEIPIKDGSDSRLNGRVDDHNFLLRANKAGDPLSRSVKVLSGLNPLQGRSDNTSLDSNLSTDNFNLPVRKMNPAMDDPRANQAALNAMRNSMTPGFSWGVGQWNVNEWGGWVTGPNPGGPVWVGGWSNSFNWDSGFEPGHMRVTLPTTTPKWGIPSISAQLNPPNDSNNTSWAIQPMTMPAPGFDEKNILWDAWYQQVSRALYQNWQGRGEQPGQATLHITVRRPRQITAELVRSNNLSPAFKSGLMTAIASLNGSSILDFPSQSMKQSVGFDSVFCAGNDTMAGAFSDRHGEFEQIRTQPGVKRK